MVEPPKLSTAWADVTGPVEAFDEASSPIPESTEQNAEDESWVTVSQPDLKLPTLSSTPEKGIIRVEPKKHVASNLKDETKDTVLIPISSESSHNSSSPTGKSSEPPVRPSEPPSRPSEPPARPSEPPARHAEPPGRPAPPTRPNSKPTVTEEKPLISLDDKPQIVAPKPKPKPPLPGAKPKLQDVLEK